MTVTYSSAGMSGLVNSVLDSMNIDTAAEGVAIDIGEVISKATVSNGKISGMDMNMKCDINSIGNVTITLPSDLDSYTCLLYTSPVKQLFHKSRRYILRLRKCEKKK